jgi:hypothetical protein
VTTTTTKKVFRAIRVDELEMATRDGWQLHDIRSECRIVTHDETGSGFHMGSGASYQQANYGAAHQSKVDRFPSGDILIFVVWKDTDLIDREASAEARASEAEKTLRKATEALGEVGLQLAEKSVQFEKAIDRACRAEAGHDEMQSAKRKLEGDLAKIRKAIGDLEWKRILELP